MSNIIDSFFVALGYKVDTAGIEQMKAKVDEAKSSILSWGSAITALVGGAALKKIADIGSTFEQNGIQIAGFLSALSNGKTTYEEGLVQARDVMQQITTDAAKLPGEAEEYIEVFKAGLPFVQGAMPGGSLKDMTDFTNRLTAIGKTFGLDAGLIAREFDHMLTPGKGTAGLRLPLFRQLMPFMRQVQGQANLTAESFNQMTAPARLQLLQATFAKLQPMLDASADSFDAMWGTLMSMVKQLTRMGTGGLFSTMKKQIAAFSAQFIDADGKLTKTGETVVAQLSKVGKVVGAFMAGGVAFVKWIADNDAAASTLGLTLKVLAAFIGGLGLAVVLVAQDLWGFYNGMDSVTGELVEGWEPAIYAVVAALIVLTALFSPLLLAIGAVIFAVYELKSHWQEVLDYVQGGLNGWLNVINKVIDGMNAVNRFLGADDDHLIKRLSGFNFADTNRNSEFAAANLAPGGGVLAPSYGPQASDAALWQPGFSMAGGGGSTVNHGDQHNVFHITAPDAKSAGEEVVRRLSRTSQSGLVR